MKNPSENQASARLANGKQKIMDGWLQQIREEVPAASDQKMIALRDAIPTYLDELIRALSLIDSEASSSISEELGRKHGTQRSYLDGYTLFQVIFEYRVLRQVILKYLEQEGPLSIKERDIILDNIQSAMGQAASEFAQRELEVEKKGRERAETAEVKLKAANENLTQFGYIVAHDLKEPLRMIASYVGLLERKWDGNLDEETRSYIAFAADGAKKMQRRIEALLALSQWDAPVALSEVDLNECLDNVLRDLSVLLQDTHTSVHYDPLPKVRGHLFEFGEVFQNLLENAIKFRGDHPPQIQITHSKQNKRVVVSLKDNGIGFKPEQASKIFTVFSRLHSEADYSGAGIGLSICKKIIERHGGRIWADSVDGEGSTFSFELPSLEA